VEVIGNKHRPWLRDLIIMHNRKLNHMRVVHYKGSVHDLRSIFLDAGISLVRKPSCVGCSNQ